MNCSVLPSFKVAFVGPTNVGKTSLLMRVDKNEFSPDDVTPTLSMQCFPHQYESSSGKKILINYWDTAGQERFKTIAPMYYQNAQYCIAVFDVTSIQTFEDMKDYIGLYKENCKCSDPKVLIAANKHDLGGEHEEIMKYVEWAESNGYKLFVTSAKTGENISEMVQQIVDDLAPEDKEDDVEKQVEPEITITEVKTPEAKSGCC